MSCTPHVVHNVLPLEFCIVCALNIICTTYPHVVGNRKRKPSKSECSFDCRLVQLSQFFNKCDAFVQLQKINASSSNNGFKRMKIFQRKPFIYSTNITNYISTLMFGKSILDVIKSKFVFVNNNLSSNKPVHVFEKRRE